MGEIKISYFRVFIAIPLPAPVRRGLMKIQAGLKSKGIKASWTKPGALHLTLKFMGNIPIHDLEFVKAAMVKTMAGFPRFELSTSRLGVFPNPKKPRVLWVGVEGRTDRLDKLFKTLETQLTPLGIKNERSRFSPHITLARLKKSISPALVHAMQESNPPPSTLFQVPGIELFKSELTPLGAVHTGLFQVKIKD
ncbi:MAG: RNA 2',3'-cyclic phosphodiesterase [Desulfobacteraceae bacterium]|nr:RNA 2',3'-cyclic phosphodiesterase [Desulfobacteraceae bacterium]